MKTHKIICLFALVALTALSLGCGSSAQPLTTRAQPASALDRPARTPLKLPLKDPRVEVHKGERKLFLYAEGKLLRTYKVGLGLSPVGDKERSGDHRTPEGDFYIFVKNRKSAFYFSLGVSYPNAAHAERGLRDGLINKTQYNQINEAVKQKRTPPQHTRLGGDIFIHGNGGSSDWTWGCVALENDDMKELYDALAVGTPVTIKP